MSLALIASVLAVSALAATVSGTAESGSKRLVMSVEVTRHCERQPTKSNMFQFALDPAEEFTVAGNCTMTGIQHHYRNGQRLRSFYGDFVSAAYDDHQVYLQTTDVQRTIDSAWAQLDGLYTKPISWPSVDVEFWLNTIPTSDDLLLHASEDNC